MDKTRLPVLIASGFGPLPPPTDAVRDFYRQRGIRISFVPFRFSSMRNVKTYAQEIAKTMRDHGRINLIGFSMGGVASLFVLKRMGFAASVASFVAYGAPFQGTDVALLALPTGIFASVGRQLRPRSRFLKSLVDGPLPDGPRIVSIGGTRDLICPAESTLLPGAENFNGPFGHADFFTDLDLHAFIESHLE